MLAYIPSVLVFTFGKLFTFSQLVFFCLFFWFLSGSVRAIFLEHVDRLATTVAAAVIIFNPIRAGMSFFFGKGQIDLPTSSGYE